MTLKEIIELRQDRYVPVCSQEFKSGWHWAYQDLKEILEQNDFDMNVVVIGKGE